MKRPRRQMKRGNQSSVILYINLQSKETEEDRGDAEHIIKPDL
jgi:hypothetical protein